METCVWCNWFTDHLVRMRNAKVDERMVNLVSKEYWDHKYQYHWMDMDHTNPKDTVEETGQQKHERLVAEGESHE